MMDERPPGPLRAPFTVLYVVFADQSHVSVDILSTPRCRRPGAVHVTCTFLLMCISYTVITNDMWDHAWDSRVVPSRRVATDRSSL